MDVLLNWNIDHNDHGKYLQSISFQDAISNNRSMRGSISFFFLVPKTGGILAEIFGEACGAFLKLYFRPKCIIFDTLFQA